MLTVTLNPTLELFGAVAKLEPDVKLRVDGVTQSIGGGGINVARAARRLGADVVAAVFVANASSQLIHDVLTKDDVPFEALPTQGHLRESLTFTDTSTAQQFRFVMPGAPIEPVDFAAGVHRIIELAVSRECIVVSGSCPPGFSDHDVKQLVAAAVATGATVVVDTSGPALVAAAEIGVRVMKPSARELSEFAGRELSSHREIEAAARQLLALGPNGIAVVSLGERGALLVSEHHETVLAVPPSVVAATTVGAGDCMVAGLAVGMSRGMPIANAVRYGVACGTAATLRPGADLCRAVDVDRLFSEVTISSIEATPT